MTYLNSSHKNKKESILTLGLIGQIPGLRVAISELGLLAAVFRLNFLKSGQIGKFFSRTYSGRSQGTQHNF